MLRKMCQLDAKFLSDHNLMDYSLLIKIEKAKKNWDYSDQMDKRNIFISEDGKELYHLGTIDYLQQYDLFKKFEHHYLVWNQKPEKAITYSCQPPSKYALRFVKFMEKNVIQEQEDAQEPNTALFSSFKKKFTQKFGLNLLKKGVAKL